MKKDIIVAPLRGLTGKECRAALSHHYSGITACMLPFFSVTESSLPDFKRFSHNFTEEELHFSAPYLTIPQLLGNNPAALAKIAAMLVNNGYDYVNLNLGCPMPQITKKMRGSGLLPYPDKIAAVLDAMMSVPNLKLSVKLRLGLTSCNDIFQLTDVLNIYPLCEVIVHPRLASEKYSGVVNLDVMKTVLPLLKTRVVYNGDITDLGSFFEKAEMFPSIEGYMLGRGIIANPALAEEINNGVTVDYDLWYRRFVEFYSELIDLLEARKADTTSRLKAYWRYFQRNVKDGKEVYSQMVRKKDIEDMRLHI